MLFRLKFKLKFKIARKLRNIFAEVGKDKIIIITTDQFDN